MSREAAGLYVHVPFCSAICPYCDFAVLVGGRDRRAGYLASLQQEMALWKGRSPPIDTVYLGGGTPSSLEPEQLAEILGGLEASIPHHPGTFRVLEANPEDVDRASLRAWRQLGFDMISLGVQSLDGAALGWLGRNHDPEQAEVAVREALQAGFEIVSLDLIYGLPAQSSAAWRQQLESALALRPDHLSCYQLTIEPRTTFGKMAAKGELRPLADAAQSDLFLLTHQLLADHGYPAYEVSNFARSEAHRSPHNQKYWQHLPYLGLGPSAHSYRDGKRWWNHRHLDRWRRHLEDGRLPRAGEEQLSLEQQALETVMLGLRTARGIDLDAFEERFGFDLVESNERFFEELTRGELLRLRGRSIEPTLRGFAVAEGIAARFRLS